MDTQGLSLLRGELVNVISGAFFVFIGAIAFSIAAIRRRGGVRILVWIGIWSMLFGSNMLAESAALGAALGPRLDRARELWFVSGTYLTIVAAALAYLELTLGGLRRLMLGLLAADVAVAVGGIGAFVWKGRPDALLLYNELLAVVGLVILLTTLSVPALSRKYLVLAHHRVLTVGTVIFAAEALWVNVARPFNVNVPAIYSSLGFAVLLLSFAYVALQMILESERRLLAIDNELKIARQLQSSILPASPPNVERLQIAAAYEPMTAVAGDFYEFIPGDERRAGFLVADVSGHGVPAALIASMIKVATQSLDGCASDPGKVLGRLAGVLDKNLRGQFVSAAYLWVDTASGSALYSAAGHPPLLRWNRQARTLERIESNGLLFGVMAEVEYPVCKIALEAGDRLLMYTDGVTEAENGAGEQFGERRLEEVVRGGESLSATEMLKRVMEECRAWQPVSVPQQDDITLIVIDVGQVSC